MDKSPPDHPFVAIIYFTEEEHAILHSYFAAKATQYGFKVKGSQIDWYEATKQVPAALGLKFYLMNGLRAPSGAKDFCHELLSYGTPTLVVNIGTAGCLVDWVGIGDIVIPQNVASWDDDSTVTSSDKGHGFVLQTNSKSVHIDHQKSISSQLNTSFPESYKLWKAECERTRNEVASDTAKLGISLSCPPKIHNGDLASGSSVVKSEELKAQVRSSNKNFLAVEMESYAVASTLEYRKIPILIIRTVTDPATNEEKNRIDAVETQIRKVTFPAVRYYALTCAAALLKHIVHRHPVVEELNLTDTNTLAKSHLADHVARKLKSLSPQDQGETIAAYSRYFSVLLKKTRSEELFDDLLSQILVGSSHFRISGTPGSGKSTLLSCLYIHHLKSWTEGKTEIKPHYIDLNYYMVLKDDYGIRTDLDLLGSSMERKFGNVLYVDSHDEYLRDDSAAQLQFVLHRFFLNGQGVKGVFAMGIADKRCGLEDGSVAFSLPCETLLELDQCQQNEKGKWEQLISEFCSIPDKSMRLSQSQIEENLKIMDVKDLDLFTLSLVTHSSLQRSFKKDGVSLGSVYFDFVVQAIQSICEVGTDEAETYLKDLAAYVYSQQISETRFECVHIENEAWSTNFRALNQFILQHPSLRQFLIAEHILNICLTTPDSLGYRIYSYGINRFVKTLANRNDKTRRSLFDGILRVMEEKPDKPLSQAHLAYLLGRLKLRNVDKRKAEEKLSIYLEKAKKSYVVFYNSRLKTGEGFAHDDLAWSMLLLRTLYVSLIYMGDQIRAEEYVRELLRNDEWASLNDGFHMQYYGDLPSGMHRMNMVARDIELEVEPREVHSILCGDLDSYIGKGSWHPRSFIELHTLLSLHINRHLEGTLPEDLRIRCHDVASKVEQMFRDNLPAWYLGYLDLSLKILSKPGSRPLSFITSVFSLKDQLRSGWSYAGQREGKEVLRRVSRSMRRDTVRGLELVKDCQPESVADHSWACAMLAWMTISERDGVKVDHVIKLCLLHDLAETVTGDLCGGADKSGATRVAAELGAVGYLKRFKGANSWTELFDEIERKSTEEAKVAHDIDKIERYLQAIEYAKGSENQISDLPDWRPSQLLSKTGRELLRNIEQDLASAGGLD